MATYPEMAGRVALVTGGSSGIGLATVRAFAAQNATVVMASRRADTGEAALDALGRPGNVSWVACDTSSDKDVAALCALVADRHGGLDYAFNNGGSGGTGRPVVDMAETAWRRTIDGYLTSVFLCLRHQIPLVRPGGAIVNNASVDGLRGYPFPGGAAYAAAKHGVLGLTRSAALEHAATGPRINAVCPGWVDTPAIARYLADPAKKAAILAQTPRGRIAAPEEVADAVLFLCSAGASYLIGHALAVDGGYMA